MKTKTLYKTLSMILLTAILAVSMIAAVANFTVAPTSLSFKEPTTQLTFTITPPAQDNNPATPLVPYSYTIAFPTILQNNGQPVTFSLSGTHVNGNLIQAITSPEIVTLTSSVNYNEISIGKTYSGNIVITNVEDDTKTLNLPVSFIGSFCKSGEKGTDLEISDVKISNSDGDDEEWSPLDEVEIEVEVSNNGDEKISDIIVELGLFNQEGKNIVKDLEFEDKKEIDLGSIKDSDEDTAIFKFKVPKDFDSENYKLTIKAYSDDKKEENLCTSSSSDLNNEFYQTISGTREEDEERHIIVDNIQFSPTIAQCNEKVQVTSEVVNIGDEDYQDQVKITLFNKDLNLNLEKIIRKDMDQGDSEVAEFEFDVPQGTAEKLYTLEFKTYYDYDEDDNNYDLESDEKFIATLRVEGNCQITKKAVRITAELDDETPEAKPGKQVIVNADIKNTGDVETTYTISVSGNTAWSELVSIEPQLTLKAGESRKVAVVLDISEEAEGDKEFTIKATFDGQIADQKVQLSLETAAEQETELGPVVQHLKNNWFIYLIILVNIILIIAIVLVIRSMVSPRPM